MATYSGTVIEIYYNNAVKISFRGGHGGGPGAGERILGLALVRKLTRPGVTLAKGDAITVEMEDGELVSIKK